MNNDVKTMTDGAAVVVGLGGFMGWVTHSQDSLVEY